MSLQVRRDPRAIVVYEHLCAVPHLDGMPAADAEELRHQGRAMRDAMLQDLRPLGQRRVCCVVCSSDAEALPLPTPGVEPLLLPPTADPAAWLRHMAIEHDALVWAVAPETGAILETLARAVPPSRWLGCSAEAIATAASKQATTTRLAAAGLPVPVTHAAPPSRWIVKPDDGAGATATRLHADRAAAEADAAHRGARCAVEPWIDGEPLSLSLVCREGEAPRLLAVNRQHIEVDATGTLHFRGVTPAALPLSGLEGRALQALAERLAQALPGLAGYVGIDLVWNPVHGPVVIEVNPRLTSAYVGLSAAVGTNVAALILQGHGG